MKQIEVGKNDANQRLDKFLLKTFPNLSKSMMYKAIRNKKIKVNRKRCTYNQILQVDDSILLFLPPDVLIEKKRSIPQGPGDLNIIYEDDNILVIHKPKGLLSQSDTSKPEDCVVNRLYKYLYDKGEYDLEEHSFTPAICQRLDRNTEGLMVACKNAQSLRIMNAAIANHQVQKRYRTIVQGKPESGPVHLFIKKEGTKAHVSRKKRPSFQSASMDVQVISCDGKKACIEIALHTGRFHQIRACMAYLGHPLIGDHKYGYTGKEKQYDLKAYYLDLHEVNLHLSQKVFQC